MAAWYTSGFRALDGEFDLAGSVLKVILLKQGYKFDPRHAKVSDLAAYECDAAGYEGGYGGAGRRVVAVVARQNDAINSREWAVSDRSWPALGGSKNCVVVGAALVRECGGSDDAAVPVAWCDLSNGEFLTNGSDFLLDFPPLSAGGSLRLTA